MYPLDAIFEKLKNRVFLSILAFISLESVYITKETSYRILNIIFEKSIFYDQNEILSAKKDQNDVLWNMYFLSNLPFISLEKNHFFVFCQKIVLNITKILILPHLRPTWNRVFWLKIKSKKRYSMEKIMFFFRILDKISSSKM